VGGAQGKGEKNRGDRSLWVKRARVSRSKGPESLAGPSSPESLALHTMILQENITLTMFFLEIIMVMSMLNTLVPMMVTLNMLFGCPRFL
jgi:hypothetical protein